LFGEFEKDLVYKPNIKFGAEYRPVDKFSLRGGINSYPIQGTFGFGLHLKGFNLDFSGLYHQILGITPQVGIHYLIKKKAKQDDKAE